MKRTHDELVRMLDELSKSVQAGDIDASDALPYTIGCAIGLACIDISHTLGKVSESLERIETAIGYIESRYQGRPH